MESSNRNVILHSIVESVPARFINFKCNIKRIPEHESILYSTKERISKEELESNFNRILCKNNDSQ